VSGPLTYPLGPSCPKTGKVSWVSKAGAKHSHAAAVGRARPYRCQFCNFWHLTTQKRRSDG
jgi:hypothetical protein